MELTCGKNVTRFFLGANSPGGFFSLYKDFVNLQEGDFLWTIKGGPGCGKSSFMKRVGTAAEAAGMAVEYIHCSGDPESIDGIYIPEKRVAYVDGTAPHVTEAEYPGCSSLYLDLGSFYDREDLKARTGEIMEVNARYKALYVSAYAVIAASAAVNPRMVEAVSGEAEKIAVARRARSAAAREMGGFPKGSGRKKYRMLSGLTCRSGVFFSETVNSICDRIYALDNEYGLAEIYLREIEAEAQRRGVDAIICPDPLATDKLEALLFPALSLGFVARTEAELGGTVYRHVRLDAVADKALLREKRPHLRALSKFRDELLTNAVEELKEAKALHDVLEGIYNPYVDFKGVYALADKHIDMMLKN